MKLSELKANIIATKDECLKFPFIAYDRGEFDYFYHLLNEAEEVINNQSNKYEIDFDIDVFKYWFTDFKKFLP